MKKIWVLLFATTLIANSAFSTEITVKGTPSTASSASPTNLFQIRWVSTNQVFQNDNSPATSQYRIQTELEYTTLLTVKGFDFSSIPNDAVIKGLEVSIKRKTEGGFSLVDRVVRLTTSPASLNYKKTANWDTTYSIQNYGSSTDSWGSILTPNILKDANFGVLMQVGRSTISGSSNQFPLIDFFQISVTYVTPLPVDLLSFKGVNNTGYNEISWETASETNSAYYVLEKSENGIDFNEIGQIEAAGFSQSLKTYSFRDRMVEDIPLTYYRLIQIDQDGAFKIYPPIAVEAIQKAEFMLYPNPANNLVTISQLEQNIRTIEILGANGNLVQFLSFNQAVNSSLVDVTELPSGSYIVQVTKEDASVSMKKFIKL